MWHGKAAGMLEAFQGFDVSQGDKKTRQEVQFISEQLLKGVD